MARNLDNNNTAATAAAQKVQLNANKTSLRSELVTQEMT
jgi:hypothetical protein